VRGAGLPARHVAIATDAQATSWRRAIVAADVDISVFAPAGAPPANHAVVVAEARPTRWTPRGSVVARTLGADSSTYRIAIGGSGNDARTLARGTAVGDSEIVVRAAPAERGWVSGSVELEPDELRGDDVRYFAAWIGAAPSVTVDPNLGAFVRTAADALVESDRLRLGPDAAVVSADAVTRLPALIVAPADPVRVGAANRALERLGVPWRFGAARHETGTAREAANAPLKLIDGATVSMRFPLTAQGEAIADTLARVGAEPWIVAGDRYVIIASPLDPAATEESVTRFLEAAAPLAEKTGPLLVQLPPTLRANNDRLRETLAAFPASSRVAVEFRHESWFTEKTCSVLRAHNAALALTDRKSRLLEPEWKTADWGYIRFHEGSAQPWPHYDDDVLAAWAERIKRCFADEDVFVYFNNDPGCWAVADAITFARCVDETGLTHTAVPRPEEVDPDVGP
jgi:hypothetical protein